MLRFLLKKLGLLIPTFIGVSIIAFAFIRLLPGDPITLLAGKPETIMVAMRYDAGDEGQSDSSCLLRLSFILQPEI